MKSSENKNITHPKKRRRKLRSEAVVVLTLGSLLLFLLSSMTISLLCKDKPVEEPVEPPITEVEKEKEALGLIVLDPGHGGYDAGGNVGDIYEKDITLSIAKLTKANLEEQGYQVILTREEDTGLGTYEFEDLSNRVYVASLHQADYFVSLHLNSSEIEDERIYGFDIYEDLTMEASGKLATCMEAALSGANYTQSRGIKDGSIMHVIEFNSVPSILIEMGFIDDDEDRTFLTSEDGQRTIGEAISKGIIEAYQ